MAEASFLDRHIEQLLPTIERNRKPLSDYIKKKRVRNATFCKFHYCSSVPPIMEDPDVTRIMQKRRYLKDYFTSHPPCHLNSCDYVVADARRNIIVAGRGNASKVLCGVVLTLNQYVAVKMTKCSDPIKEELMDKTKLHKMHKILNEFRFQEKAHHVLHGSVCTVPKPIGFLRLKSNPRWKNYLRYVIVSEFCGVLPTVPIGLDLAAVLNCEHHENSILNKSEWKEIILALIDALKLLQDNDIYHIDLQPQNIMLQFLDEGKSVFPVIVDFGRGTNSRNWYKRFKGDHDEHKWIDPLLFQYQGNPHPTTDLYSLSYTISLISEKIQLTSLQNEMQNYMKLEPSERPEHQEFRDLVNKCFDEHKQSLYGEVDPNQTAKHSPRLNDNDEPMVAGIDANNATREDDSKINEDKSKVIEIQSTTNEDKSTASEDKSTENEDKSTENEDKSISDEPSPKRRKMNP